MLFFDHIAVAALTLEEGAAHVEAALGVPLQAGGKHARMGTHNRLLGLGDLYLEVIATDPAAPPPPTPRWFDLDRFTGPPRITNWIARCDDLEADLAISPDGTGAPMSLERGDLRWRMAVPADGRLPHDGAFPALIQWEGQLHPAARLTDRGVRLTRLEIAHPDAPALRSALAGRFADNRVAIVDGAVFSMQASFATPHGRRRL